MTSSPLRKVPREVRAAMEGEGGSLRAALQRFYLRHNNENADNIQEIAKRFEGQEALLNSMLRKKYGADLTSVGWATVETREEEGMSALERALAGNGAGHSVDKMLAEELMASKERENQWKIHQENMQKIAKMSPEEMQAAHEQIAGELSPSMIKLLTNRGA